MVSELLLPLFFKSWSTALVNDSNLFFSCRSAWELCRNLLHRSEGKEHVVHCITIYIFGVHWLTWGLLSVLTRIFSLSHWASWYSHTENTFFLQQPPQWTAQKTLLPALLLLLPVSTATVTCHPLSRCLAMAVFAKPFPHNGHLCWLHSSGYQLTCNSMLNSFQEFWELLTAHKRLIFYAVWIRWHGNQSEI